MPGKRIILRLLLAAAVALPLVLCNVASAESGCHRAGSETGGDQPRVASAKR